MCRFASQCGKPALSWLWDHRVRGRALLAGAVLLEAAVASAAMLKDDSIAGNISLGGIGFVGAMLLPQHSRHLSPCPLLLQPTAIHNAMTESSGMAASPDVHHLSRAGHDWVTHDCNIPFSAQSAMMQLMY